MSLFLVRHGRPSIDPTTPAATWDLDPTAYDDVWALRERLPIGGGWYSSPEPKAVQTAQLLTDGPVGIIDDLREVSRAAGFLDDFVAIVRQGFARPDAPAVDGWEAFAVCRARVVAAVRPVLSTHALEDIVLVGHGTAWTLLVAELTGTAPDVERWAGLGLPDVIVIESWR